MMMMMTFETTHFTMGKSGFKCGNFPTLILPSAALKYNQQKFFHFLETVLPAMHFMIIIIAARHYNNAAAANNVAYTQMQK